MTPENGPAEEAGNPTKAWRALMECNGLAKRAAGLSGQRMFGLDTPTVAKLIQSLPHAARCASFEAWARDKPEPVPLVGPRENKRIHLFAMRARSQGGKRHLPMCLHSPWMSAPPSPSPNLPAAPLSCADRAVLELME